MGKPPSRKGKNRNRHDWNALKGEYLRGDWRSRADFFKAKKIWRSVYQRHAGAEWDAEREKYRAAIEEKKNSKFADSFATKAAEAAIEHAKISRTSYSLAIKDLIHKDPETGEQYLGVPVRVNGKVVSIKPLSSGETIRMLNLGMTQNLRAMGLERVSEEAKLDAIARGKESLDESPSGAAPSERDLIDEIERGIARFFKPAGEREVL